MKSLNVFCGSRDGARPEYRQAAAQLGQELARRNIELVYGGASVGLMGAVADSCLEAGGRVTGVIPHSLVELEVEHNGLTDLVLVDSLAERKHVMADRSDAFVCLPGGGGTMDELFEVFTWYQLDMHTKPMGLINTAGYWTGLVDFVAHAANEDFLSAEHRDAIAVGDTPGATLDLLTERLAS